MPSATFVAYLMQPPAFGAIMGVPNPSAEAFIMNATARGRNLLPLVYRGARWRRSRTHTASVSQLRPRRMEVRSPVGLWLLRLIGSRTQPGHPRGLMRAWPAWERIAQTLWPPSGIPGSRYGLLRMRLGTYTGEPFTLPDGVRIERNARVIELHCDNRQFVRLIAGEGLNPYRACREDLASLANWIESNAIEVEAAFGRTILRAGAARLGFARRELPATLWLRLERFFMIGLLLIYTESGLDHLTRGSTVWSYPKEFWISRKQLVRRYGRPGLKDSSQRQPVSQPRSFQPR